MPACTPPARCATWTCRPTPGPSWRRPLRTAAGRRCCRRTSGCGRRRAVPPTFDARFSALCRRYEYRVTDAPYGAEPLRRHDTLALAPPAGPGPRSTRPPPAWCGEHDFAAYCKRKEHATTVRAITRLDWRRDPDGVLVATVAGRRVLPGDGAQPGRRDAGGRATAAGPAWPASLLRLRERSSEVTVAPAHGLTLVEVGYPDDAAEYAQPRRTRPAGCDAAFDQRRHGSRGGPAPALGRQVGASRRCRRGSAGRTGRRA